MKVLMIGGTGNISSPITRKLAESSEHECYVLNRGNKNNSLPENVKVIIGDINDEEKMKDILKDYSFDVVCNFITYMPEQAKANIRLFREKTKQFIFISTAATYNHEKTVVLREDSEQFNKYSSYGQNKQTCEEIFLEAYRNEGFPITIVRPTQTYDGTRIPLSIKGKGCYSVINRMKQGKEVIIHGDGTSTWVCTHSEDFAKGFVGLIGNEKAINNAYQITSDEVVNWDIIYRIIAKELGVEYKPVYITSDLLSKSKKYDLMMSIKGDKQYSVVFDTSKIKSIVPDFNCTITIEEGLKRYLKMMDENPELQVIEPDYDEWCDRVISTYKEAIKKVEDII